MNTTETTTDLRTAALAAVRPFVPRRASRPTMLRACERAAGGRVEITAWNGDESCAVSFFDRIVGFTDRVIDKATGLDTGDDPLEFPAAPTMPEVRAGFAVVPWRAIRRVADLIVPATDDESSRYALGAVRVESGRLPGMLDFVGTDGRRMHCLTSEPATLDGTIGANVPAEFVTRFVRAVRTVARVGYGHGGRRLERSLDCGDVRVAFTDRCVTLAWYGAGVAVTAQAVLIEGRFPRWRDIFPAEVIAGRAVASLDAGPLAASMREAAAAIKAHYKGTKPGHPSIKAGVRLLPGGTAEASCGAWGDRLPGDVPVRCVFNPTFLADALDGVVEFDGSGPTEFRIDAEVRKDGTMGAAFLFAGAWMAGGYGFAAALMPVVND